MMNTSFLWFLCFLARQRARLGTDRREAFFQAVRAGCVPPMAEFFALFPEMKAWRERPASWWRAGAIELERECEKGRRFFLFEDDEFPLNLRRIPDPPWVLSSLGDPQNWHLPSLSVVGARDPMPASLRWMNEHLDALLGRLPFPVVSGGARGIDQMAHRLALRNQNPTLIFLPAGLARLYPADLKDWVLPVLEGGGAFISEFHPRTPMRKWNFQQRNRLIAGLSPVTLVIEARLRSGTWITAQAASDANRTVACLPGSPWESSLSGNLQLLSQGAVLIKDAQDLVMILSSEMQSEKAPSLAIETKKQSLH